MATWSGDGQWIVLVDQRTIRLVNFDDPTITIELEDVVPDGHFVLAAG